MIPKIIHYCWFGKGKKDETIIKCMESWKKFCPDYEIKEWNEENFDINFNSYVKEAYNSKKWAFVSDYVRLYALYTHGGIYVDTDLEITKEIDDFLVHNAFIGYESKEYISTAIIGASKENEWIKELIDFYKEKKFLLKDGSMDLTTNVEYITKITKEKYKININGEKIEFGNGITIYPKEYFCKFNIKKEHLNCAIHHFNGSWLDKNKYNEIYKEYYFIMNLIIEDMYNGNIKLKKFINKNKVSIYGFGTLGKLILKQLNEIGIKPEFIVDINCKINKYGGIPITKTVDKNYNSDIIIVTPIKYFNNIYIENKNKFCGEIFDIREIYQ